MKAKNWKLRRLPPGKRVSPVDDKYSVDERTALILEQISHEAMTLPDKTTRELWLDALHTFASTGDIDSLVSIASMRRKVVPLDTFMFDSAYLALDKDEIYPGVIEACNALDTGTYIEAVLKGAIGCQPAGQSVLMADGRWKDISEVRKGDEVVSPQVDGSSIVARVMDTFSFEDVQTYELECVGNGCKGKYTASYNHIVPVVYKENDEFVLENVELQDLFRRTEKPLAGAECFTSPLFDLPDAGDTVLPPYLVGVLVGNGLNSLRTGEFLWIIEKLGEFPSDYMQYVSDSGGLYGGTMSVYVLKPDVLKAFYKEQGTYANPTVLGLCDAYLRTSADKRIQFLSGILRSSLVANKVSVPYKHIADNVRWLVHSLGGVCRIRSLAAGQKSKVYECSILFDVDFADKRIAEGFEVSSPYTDEANESANKVWRATEQPAIAPRGRRAAFTVTEGKVCTVYGFTLTGYSQWYVTNDFLVTHNTGKSTIANIMIPREIYKLSCMRHPQASLGVQSGSSLVFTVQSVRLTTARRAIFEEMGRYIRSSPYFTTVFQYDRHILSEMVFREFNIRIFPVSSTDTGAISFNVLGGVLDEVNFLQKIDKSKSSQADDDGTYDQAKNLYNILSRRRRSRFTVRGKVPGILFLISSSRYPTDFTETRAELSTMCGGTDSSIYVFSRPVWESRHIEKFMTERFRVQIGTEKVRSKILAANEQAYPECRVIEVPMDYYDQFEVDTDGAIRDFAGITTLAKNPFIAKRTSIHECVELAEQEGYYSIFNVTDVDLNMGLPTPVREKLGRNPDAPRACHIDLSLSKDSCGIAIGHLIGTKVIQRENTADNSRVIEVLPVVAMDVVLRVVPPPNGEIEFSKVRHLIVNLRNKYDVPIKYVTLDGFNSADSRQILASLGFKTGYLSVDRNTDPYNALRDALYDKRILLPRHPILMKELAELEKVTTSSNKEKIDHPVAGSKDCSDAVAGVFTFLMRLRMAWHGLPVFIPRNMGGQAGAELQALYEGSRMRKTHRKSISRKSMRRSSVNRISVANNEKT